MSEQITNNQVVEFDDGSVTLELFHAGGPVVRWYPNDINFVDRLSRFEPWLDGFAERLRAVKGLTGIELDETGKPVKAPEEYEAGTLEKMGDEFCAELDRVFDMPISAAAFAKVNPISPTASGAMVFENFLDAIMPFIEKSFDGFSASRERYTAKFKNRAERRKVKGK